MYVFLGKDNIFLYVGKAKDLKSRVSSYFVNSGLLGAKTRVMVSQIEKIKITIVESEVEALLLEAFYIKKYQPKYNIRLTDNKSYVRIQITLKDRYPRVLLARRENDENSIFFGPYPSSSAVKMVLKIMRKIFPFQSVYNHPKRVCLYHHLGLCPCPPVFDSQELQKEYRKNIKGIIRMLEGESKKVMSELEKERDALSNEERFEEAAIVQRKINALSIITTPFHRPFEYDVNPNLRSDIRQQELDGLMAVLNTHGFQLQQLQRIECYDISNTQGTHATGSMVVFVNGEKESSQYRKFKIRREWDKRQKKEMPNDFAMMQEVLKRRFNHNEWDLPDLVIVDGGKGQVSSALQTFEERSVSVPLIGLAKREETIIIHNIMDDSKNMDSRLHGNDKEQNFIEVSLPKNSPSLHLIMRIRDEAHRFAITYHRLLRSKDALLGK